MEKVTADTILNWLQEQVETKSVINKDEWLGIAFKLNTLLLNENEIRYDLKQKIAQKRFDIIQNQDKINKSLADAEIETLDEYREMKIQEAKIDQILEFVRIAKKQSELF